MNFERENHVSLVPQVAGAKRIGYRNSAEKNREWYSPKKNNRKPMTEKRLVDLVGID